MTLFFFFSLPFVLNLIIIKINFETRGALSSGLKEPLVQVRHVHVLTLSYIDLLSVLNLSRTSSLTTTRRNHIIFAFIIIMIIIIIIIIIMMRI